MKTIFIITLLLIVGSMSLDAEIPKGYKYISPDGKYAAEKLIINNGDNSLVITDAKTHNLVSTMDLETSIDSIEWLHDSRTTSWHHVWRAQKC